MHDPPPAGSVPPPSVSVVEVPPAVPPAQVVCGEFATIVTPDGSVSENAIPETAGAPTPVLMVSVSVKGVPRRTIAGVKDFASAGKAATTSWELKLGAPTGPVWSEVKPVTFACPFGYVATIVDVTGTVRVHEVGPAGSDTPASDTLVDEVEGVPETQLVCATPAVVRFVDSVSVKPKPLNGSCEATVDTVILSVEVPPTKMADGSNSFSSCGAPNSNAPMSHCALRGMPRSSTAAAAHAPFVYALLVVPIERVKSAFPPGSATPPLSASNPSPASVLLARSLACVRLHEASLARL